MPRRKDWSAPQQSDRRRKMVALTLSDEARARLDALAKERTEGNRSALVEALILATR